MRAQTFQHYVERARMLGSYPELDELMEALTPKLGFDYFAIAHYVNDPLAANLADLCSLPDRWAKTAREFIYRKDGPVAAICKGTLAGFVWSELPDMVALTPRQRTIWNAACARGDGLTVPANIPAGVSGSISFVVDNQTPLPRNNFHAAQFIGCIAYEAGLRISARERFPAPPPPDLSARQLDCIILAARGKTDWEIGQALAISKETAHKHIQSAMRRLGVTTRTQLVVRALFDSQVTFSDVLR